MVQMMACRLFVTVVFFCVVFVHQSQGQHKISVPRVLLPRATNVITNFTLRVTDGETNDVGCFSWESTREDVVTVQAMSENEQQAVSCSSSAVVSAVSRSANRLTSIVWAQSHGQSERFRCDVIVDSITSIEIETTTQELFLEDAPVAFEIRAKDAKGDIFTSLEGLEFEWTIQQDKAVENSISAHNILRIIKFSETQYKPLPSVSVLENEGRRGFMVLVEGMQTGSAIVSAVLKNSDVNATSVRIVVVANLMLLPPHDIYLLQHGTIHYRVQQIKQASSFDIEMPSKQYYLEVMSENVCRLDAKTTTVVCAQLGDAQVLLKDRNMQQSDAHPPTATIHVVQVAYINLVILPGRSWILETGRTYEMMVELYDRDSHLVYISDNVGIHFELNQEYFTVLHSSHNGSYHSVVAKKTGKTSISAQLASIDRVKFESLPALSKRQNVEIFDPVVVKPSILAFPFQADKEYRVALRAKGGSGNYSWSSNNSGVTTVERSSGVARLGMREGWARVTVADLRNVAHFDVAVLYILPVADLMILPSVREAQINTSLILPIAIRGRLPGSGRLIGFYDCRKVSLQVSIEDEGVFQREEVGEGGMTGSVMESVGKEGGCTFVKLRALTPGFTTVVLSYSLGGRNDSPVIATEKLTIAAFPALRSAEGASQEAVVLTVGSSKLFHFKGGPAPWIDNVSGHGSVMTGSEQVTVSRTVGGSALSALKEVTCASLGQEEMTLRVANTPSTTLPKPVTAELKVVVLCAEPASFTMTPIVQQDPSLGLPKCAWQREEASHNAFPVLLNSPLEVELRVFDQAGREFYNFSSLHFNWKIGSERLLSVDEGMAKAVENAGKRQLLRSHDKTGRTKVEVTLDGYSLTTKAWLKQHHNLHAPHLNQKLHSGMEVVVVQEPSFDKSSLVLFNHPANKESVSIRDGSGFFHIVSSQPSMAKVQYELKSRTLLLVPGQGNGQLTITAYDVCTTARPIQLAVTVAGLQRLQVIAGDKVQVGNTIPLLLRVYDTENELLPTKNYPLIELQPVVNGESLVLQENDKQDSGQQRMYSLLGSVLGRTILTFKAKQANSTEVTSNSVDIQVFPPLRLEPRNITLLPTATFQVSTHGGPQVVTVLRFSSGKSSISSVDTQSGLIEGLKVGSSIVTAQLLDTDPVTQKEVVLSQDQVNVHVVELKGWSIHSPIRLIEVGQEVPLTAMGLSSGQTPFAFGSVRPEMKFTWSIDNSDVAEVKSGGETAFNARLVAKSPGVVTVSLKGGRDMGGGKVRLKVVEALTVMGMGGCRERSLLMTPNTVALLRTSRDGEARMGYRVVEGEDLLQIDGQGVMVSGERTGRALVETTAEEAGLTRTVTTQIEIKETAYLTVDVMSDLHISTSTTERATNVLPVGLSVPLNIRLHDDLGRVFYATRTNLKLVKHRNDLLHTTWASNDNMTLIVKPLKEGQTIIKVLDNERDSVFDFISLKGISSISPASDMLVTVGDVVCYTCPILTRDGHSGRWSSSTPSLLHMSSQSGVALALAAGTAGIQYNISTQQTLKTHLIIQPIQRVQFSPPQTKLSISNSLTDSGLKVPVSLGGYEEGRRLCGEQELEAVVDEMKRGWQVEKELFSCGVEFDQVHPTGVTASEVFDVKGQVLDDGHFGCLLQAKNVTEDVERALSLFDARLFLSLRPATNIPQQDVDVMEVDFLPAFHIDSKDVQLKHNAGFFTLTATPAVKAQLVIKSSHPESLHIGAPYKMEDGSHRWRYPLTFLPNTNPSSSIHINVHNPRTKHDVNVPVKVARSSRLAEEGQGFSLEDVWSRYAVPGLIIGLLMAVVWLLYRFWQENEAQQQYRRYYAIAGHAPPNASTRSSPLSISSASKTPSPTKSVNQSYLGPPVATLFKREDGMMDHNDLLSDGLDNVHLYSTNRRLATTNGSLDRPY